MSEQDTNPQPGPTEAPAPTPGPEPAPPPAEAPASEPPAEEVTPAPTTTVPPGPVAAISATEAKTLAAALGEASSEPSVPTALEIDAALAANTVPASIVAPLKGYLQEGAALVDLGGGRVFELQCAFMAEAKLRELLFQDEVFDPQMSSFDLAQQRLAELEQSGKNRTFPGLAWYARVSAAVVRAALQRHHPEAAEDEVDDVVDALGNEGEPIMLCHALYITWLNVDRLGPYVDRIDPEVTVGTGGAARTYKLRFANRALRMVAEHLQAENREQPTFRDFVEITRAGLARWHAVDVHRDAPNEARIVDDVAWRVGLQGMGRLMRGSEQPKRTEAQAEGGSPNAQAGPEGPANGTGTVSS